MKQPPVVLVVWEDAKTLDVGPWADNRQRPYKPHLVQQVGFLLSDTPEGIHLTQAWHSDLIASRDQIPRGMIRSVTILQPAAPTKRGRA